MTRLGWLLVFFLSACDTQNVDTIVDPLPELLPIPVTEAVVSNGVLSMRLDHSGLLGSVRLLPEASQPTLNTSIGSSLGLWFAGSQNGIKANVMPYLRDRDGFELQPSVVDGGGHFLVNKANFLTGYDTWPIDLGAPTYEDGSPKMMGDVMAWGTYESASTSGISGNSFSGLHVVVNPYVFEDKEFKSTLFVRYEISNRSTIAIENLHIGFGGDIDLLVRDSNLIAENALCGQFTQIWNNTGYDFEKNYTYTYVKPDSADGDIPPECYGSVVGYSILGSNSTNGIQPSILAHPVLNEVEEESFEGFSEAKIKTPTQVQSFLQGLSIDGASMIDPITQQPTRFAYTGDPLTGTGWVDTRKDARSVQSIAPITLAPGETVVTNVVIFTVKTPSFEQGFAALSALYDTIIANRYKWDY